MIGLGFFLAFFLYIGLALLTSYWIRRPFNAPKTKRIAQVLTLITFALIPTWDIIPGKLYFNNLCETEGGLKIYKTVEGVEGFYYEPGASPSGEVLRTYGYKFVEGAAGGATYRYTLSVNGKIVRDDIAQPISRYSVKSERYPPRWNTVRHQKVVEDRQTKEILAIRTQFEYLGNWFQQTVSPLLGGGAFCTLPPNSDSDFYLKTLKPVK